MIDRTLLDEAGSAAARISPPALVAGASISGMSMQQWVYILTAGFIVLQAAYLCWKWWREAHPKRHGDAG